MVAELPALSRVSSSAHAFAQAVTRPFPRPCGSRWLNIIFGMLYTAIILITMWDWAFSVFYGIIEVMLTGLIAWYAWTWPKREAA